MFPFSKFLENINMFDIVNYFKKHHAQKKKNFKNINMVMVVEVLIIKMEVVEIPVVLVVAV